MKNERTTSQTVQHQTKTIINTVGGLTDQMCLMDWTVSGQCLNSLAEMFGRVLWFIGPGQVEIQCIAEYKKTVGEI